MQGWLSTVPCHSKEVPCRRLFVGGSKEYLALAVGAAGVAGTVIFRAPLPLPKCHRLLHSNHRKRNLWSVLASQLQSKKPVSCFQKGHRFAGSNGN